ncbi:AAA family ATPase [Agrobacterium vitis]|uniref:AAA family ATPase n=1 Tax=Agrobacterium vitis TaxID=373 RepID=UPI000871C2AE|nr:ATP-binding protein [Agrobacterium vitis]MCE6074869.1 AAA family ATPase [Agrobacterium vitis]MCM2467726.1 AAA family ATPase [Agrobacterium vitis]MUO68369.1 AAA family ATPase [Agrobacterium vitis]MUO83413.1 AAA family ATPase [Agrobacterium vitis]MVA34911.1 AAA family ATPase [Agrobacterium vitis]
MPGSIEIRNLRNIQHLKFLIPDRGVWLLTGANGAGKTSLLACIRRLGSANAFPVHFPTSLRSDRLDNHSTGTVTYEINGSKVEYAYRGERWTPRPRSAANLFENFGYASITYIGATADRITPRPEDFDTHQVKAVASQILTAANQIFQTDKFTKLRSINLSRGTGNDAFVLALGTTPQTYHSEKHFSLGELCVLKLLRLLKDVPNNSMIIVDELEMALHPRAQVELLHFLEQEAKKKSLTVIFSTHSVTLLKTIKHQHIIYLEKQEGGIINPVVGCFPTYAIGNIAADEETLPDIMLYVEDLFARDFLNAFYDLFVNEKYADPTLRPSAKIVPVGGFNEVVGFLDRNRSVLPNSVKQMAVLDQDVAKETIKQWQNSNNHAKLTKHTELQKYIAFLPFTPEVGFMDYANINAANFEQKLRERYSDNQLHVQSILAGYDKSLTGSAQRQAAKKSINQLMDYLKTRTQGTDEVVREKLSGLFANMQWNTYKSSFMTLFGALT